MKIKISAEYSGVLPTGSYQNARPGFSAEVELDYDGLPDGIEYQKVIDIHQKQMHKICYDNFKKCEEQAIFEKIQRERADVRIKEINGVLMPSVTSVINFDADMWVTPEDLQQYASQGQIIHAQVAHFISEGVWKEPKDIPEIWSDLVIVSKGKLRLSLNGWDFPGFIEKFPCKDLKNSSSSYSEEYRFCGTPDFECIPNFKEADGIPTLCDVKRTPDKIKNFKQIAAYCKMKGYEHIKQMMIVPINDKTQRGFSKPIVEKRIDEYFNMFLKDREAFRKRFGV